MSIDSELELNIKILKRSYDLYKDSACVIFGTGLSGMTTFSKLKSENRKINAFIDNNTEKNNTVIEDNVKCYTPEEFIKNTKEGYVYIIAVGEHLYDLLKTQTENLLKKYNKKGIVLTKDEFFIVENFEKIKNICNNYLCDEKSKEVYKQVVLARLLNNREIFKEICEFDEQYFSLKEFKQDKFDSYNEIYVDLGSYVGDTVEKFINNGYFFKRIYAFEPEEKFFKALSTRVKRLKEEWALDEDKIICINKGIGEKSQIKYIKSITINPMSTHISNSKDDADKVCEICSLDEEVKERVDFIKADIEGYELKMLKGAKNIIKTYKPKLAICIYHFSTDLYELPNYIKELVPEYKMKIRHYSFGFGETVLYCYI